MNHGKSIHAVWYNMGFEIYRKNMFSLVLSRWFSPQFQHGQGIKYKIKIGSNIRSHNFWGRGGDGVGWGMCYLSMEGEQKDKQTWEDIWGWGWGGVGHVLPFHGRTTQGQADMCYRCIEGQHKVKQTWEDIWGWGWGWGGVGHVLPFHGRRTQG